MKRTVLFLILLCLTSLFANAQWKVTSVDNAEPNTKLLQIIDAENTTLVYASLSKDCSSTKIINLGRGTCVKAGGMKYKIINSVNLPLSDEAEERYAYLNTGNNEINFVMEFEKFPVKDGFDIIENEKEGDFHFNFHGIKVSSIEESEKIDTERFLNSGAPVIAGKYAEEGTFYLYYIKDGICVTCNAVRSKGGWGNSDEVFYLDIVNNSDHGVMFNFDKVAIAGNNINSDGSVKSSKEWAKYTPDSYEQYLQNLDYDEARYRSSAPLEILKLQLDLAKIDQKYGSWERAGLEALGALNRQAIENRIGEYMQEHPKDRPSALRTTSIKPGESIHGYIASKRKNADEAVITVTLDNYDFPFTFNLK